MAQQRKYDPLETTRPDPSLDGIHIVPQRDSSRRPITNMPDEPLNDESAEQHTGLNPVSPHLDQPVVVLDGLKSDAIEESDRILSEGTDGDIYKLVERATRAEISRAQTWATIRSPAKKKDEIVLGIIEDIVDRGRTFTYTELLERVKSSVDEAYQRSRQNQKKKSDEDPYEDPDLAGGYAMLPRWRRHPGSSSTGTYGRDPQAFQNALDEYEKQGMPTYGGKHGLKAQTLKPTENSRGDLPLETSGIESLDWITETHTVQLRCPSPLGPSNNQILKRAIKIIEERTLEGEEAGKRTDQLKKPLGTQGLQRAVASAMKISVRDVENCWRSVKRYPWDKIFTKVPRS